ncbi:MAG: helix-hairpin-helix domain-containing protein [Rhodanobacteraceae bacterium]|nr:MAG: helix-hairpin-helix domain-containing protein [Rhodanobacteraceae bacterium]
MFKKMLCALALCLAIALPAIAATPVNVNTADARAIAASLDGVGMSKAEAIVAYRKTHGPFKSIEDVGKVKGIGAKTLSRNRDAIRLDGGPAKASADDAAAIKPKRTHKH